MKTLRGTLITLLGAGLFALCTLAATTAIGNHFSAKAVHQGLDAKDVTADVLPPPLYLIELRLVRGMAVDGTLTVAEAEKEVARLVKEYSDRIGHWTKNPPCGLEAKLLGVQHVEGQRFIAQAPAVLKAAASGAMRLVLSATGGEPAEVARIANAVVAGDSATGEQTQGIGMVSTAVNQLDCATQQNASLVQESTAAAASLRDQADELVRTMRFFKVQVA